MGHILFSLLSVEVSGLKAERIVQGRVEDTLEFVWRLVGVFAVGFFFLKATYANIFSTSNSL